MTPDLIQTIDFLEKGVTPKDKNIKELWEVFTNPFLQIKVNVEAEFTKTPYQHKENAFKELVYFHHNNFESFSTSLVEEFLESCSVIEGVIYQKFFRGEFESYLQFPKFSFKKRRVKKESNKYLKRNKIKLNEVFLLIKDEKSRIWNNKYGRRSFPYLIRKMNKTKQDKVCFLFTEKEGIFYLFDKFSLEEFYKGSKTPYPKRVVDLLIFCLNNKLGNYIKPIETSIVKDSSEGELIAVRSRSFGGF